MREIHIFSCFTHPLALFSLEDGAVLFQQRIGDAGIEYTTLADGKSGATLYRAIKIMLIEGKVIQKQTFIVSTIELSDRRFTGTYAAMRDEPNTTVILSCARLPKN